MGCDIHIAVEVRNGDGKWWRDDRRAFPDAYSEGELTSKPFDWRNYGMFGFLADVRNYSHVPPISEARGLPDDLSAELCDEDVSDRWLGDHSFSWLSLAELLAFDYDQTFEDRRITIQRASNYFDGAGEAEPGGGSVKTFREFLGDSFFAHLEILKTFGKPENVRIVFGFDN